MYELRVQIEAVPTVEGDILSAWFTLPIDEELFSERLGVDAESNDYRITEKELPFAEEVDEDTTVDKATLLMALLRSVNIPCRLHAFNVSKDFQKGALPQIIYLLAPKYILHTWVEVFFNDKWIALEGVIIDKDYLYTVQQKYTEYKGIFKKFAIATKDLETVNIAWTGNDVFIQKEAVVDDYGIFSSPDILFSKHTQNMSKIKLYLYSHIGTKMMTKRVFKIRNSKK